MNIEQKRSFVLSQPFNVAIHKKTFTNYLEVIIDESGKVHYAVPSHQEKLIKLCCEKLSITRDELNDLCPKEYYCDFISWLTMTSGAVSVWDSFYIGKANKLQLMALKKLKRNQLYRGSIG
jgi:hypothetical protein